MPEGAAAQIHTRKSVASAAVELARFPMVEKDRLYRSTDYETATNRAEITLELGVGSVKVF